MLVENIDTLPGTQLNHNMAADCDIYGHIVLRQLKNRARPDLSYYAVDAICSYKETNISFTIATEFLIATGANFS